MKKTEDATTKRGGARTTGMAFGAHQLNGLTLRWRRYKNGRPIPYVCGHWTEKGVAKQNSASLETNSERAAIEHCLKPRRDAGLPVPTMAAALRVVKAFLDRGPTT